MKKNIILYIIIAVLVVSNIVLACLYINKVKEPPKETNTTVYNKKTKYAEDLFEVTINSKLMNIKVQYSYENRNTDKLRYTYQTIYYEDKLIDERTVNVSEIKKEPEDIKYIEKEELYLLQGEDSKEYLVIFVDNYSSDGPGADALIINDEGRVIYDEEISVPGVTIKLPDINSKYYKNEVFNQFSFSNKSLYLLKGGQEDDKDYCLEYKISIKNNKVSLDQTESKYECEVEGMEDYFEK